MCESLKKYLRLLKSGRTKCRIYKNGIYFSKAALASEIKVRHFFAYTG